MANDKSRAVYGIDLGTTFSCIAQVDRYDQAVVLRNFEGDATTPSVVYIESESNMIVGKEAKNQLAVEPEKTVAFIKREIGNDEAFDKSKNTTPMHLDPVEISALILKKLVQDANNLGDNPEPITDVVITCPAYFGNKERLQTKQAGISAGLNVLAIINEPTAASLAYGLDKKKDETIAVFDVGGGTFDISVLEIGDGVFEVKATNGDTVLGGDDWDDAIITWLADSFQQENGIDLRQDPMARQRLKEEAEKAKIALSSAQETDINLPFITADASGPKHLNVHLTRSKLEQICDPLYERLKTPFFACLKDAGIDDKSINELVLVGGMTRSPKVVELANALVGKQAHKGVNPDEVVAIGAAIQGGVLKGDVNDILLLDVTPLTLGIETAGGISTPMIDRNTTIPTKKTQTFSTYADNQTAVDIHVLQGERSLAKDNKTLGVFRLEGIPMAHRGEPKIEVTFDIDASGILHVTAKDVATGKDKKITITGSSGFSDEEVERLRKEAEQFAEQDKKHREEIDTRNAADQMVYQSEKTIKDLGDKLSADDKSGLEAKINDLKEALKGENIEDIKAKQKALEEKFYEVSAKVYQQANQGGDPNMGGQPGCDGNCGDCGSHGANGDGYVDADYREVNDN